jgi:hypothetical protein
MKKPQKSMNDPAPRGRGIKNALKKLGKTNFLSGTPQGAGNLTPP